VLGHQTKNRITPDSESGYYVPDGKRRVFDIGQGSLAQSVPCGREAVPVADIDLTKATGFYAKRFRPDLSRRAASRRNEPGARLCAGVHKSARFDSPRRLLLNSIRPSRRL